MEWEHLFPLPEGRLFLAAAERGATLRLHLKSRASDPFTSSSVVVCSLCLGAEREEEGEGSAVVARLRLAITRREEAPPSFACSRKSD